MGTGQMLLTVGAIVLLGTVILTTNRRINDSSEVMLKTNFGLESTSLATSIIDEAQYLPFDDSTANSFGEATEYIALSSTNQLTPVNLLGYDGGGDDTLPNDFDDYNGQPGGPGYRLVTLPMSTGIYKVKTSVCYVTPSNLEGTSLVRTWFKRMDVSVWNTADSLDTVKMSAIYSYWYFR